VKTIEKEIKIEFEEKKSKFIGYIKPVTSKEEAEEFINTIKMLHPNASHNCSAYKINYKGKEFYKTDDDGEPSGTAGKPMGEVLNHLEVSNLAVVSTRYFGGIKLGAGGLVRNYAKTAKLACLEANIIDYVEQSTYLIDFSYDKDNEVTNLLDNKFSNIIEKSYNERITYRVKTTSEIIDTIKNVQGSIVIEV